MAGKGTQTPPYWYDGSPVPWAMRLLAPLYAGVTALRRRAYRRGWRKRYALPVPVIVVGNITAGGTGKTPLTIALVERLRAAGWKPGVASRGYGREDADKPLWVQADTPTAKGGDEPVLIAWKTGVPVRVDRDRVAAGKALIEAGCDVIVCDDGLQHYRLARDIEIEVVDAQRRYGNGRMIPAGPLREPVSRASECDFRVVNLGQADEETRHRPVASASGRWRCTSTVRSRWPAAARAAGVLQGPARACGGRHRPSAALLRHAARARHRRGAACLRRPPGLPAAGPVLRQPAAGADDREGRGEMPRVRQRLALRGSAARRAARRVLGGADRPPGQAATELSGAAALAFTRRRPHSRCNEPAEYRPMTEFVVAIPARYAASRLPGKPLRLLGGEPLVLHVARRALQAGAGEVWVATDDQRIADALSGWPK
jgi:hypothetical protein